MIGRLVGWSKYNISIVLYITGIRTISNMKRNNLQIDSIENLSGVAKTKYLRKEDCIDKKKKVNNNELLDKAIEYYCETKEAAEKVALKFNNPVSGFRYQP